MAVTAVMLVLLFGAAGCAALLDYSGGSLQQRQEAKYDSLVAAREYHAARLLLDKMTPAEGGEAYEARRQRLERLVGELVTEVEQSAAARKEENDLFGAVTLVGQALQKIPENDRLLLLRAELENERDRRLAANEREMLADEAEYLYSRLQSYYEQARLEELPGRTRWRMRKMEQTLVLLQPGLLACGRQAVELEDYEVAEKCLMTAGKIDDSGAADQLLDLLEERLAEEGGLMGNSLAAGNRPLVYLVETNKMQPAEAALASFLELEEKLKAAIDKGELVMAYRILAELEKLPRRNEVLMSYRQRLDKARAERVAEQMEKGSDLYRRGKIEEARVVWRQVLVLEPDNRVAMEKITRAGQVLESIRDLQKAQKQKQ